ncbi:MAG: fluoride efflux transporter CrcB [Phycisphaeraceae bacterium]|nr:MAG: fluoride efflux transporter CrcB [Phycisphaeraceae bacterium]
MKPLLIFLGAGAGGLLRYYIGWLAQSLWGPTFPFGTLVCNVTGCLLMGFLATAWMGPVLIRDEFRVAVLVGILGGYTTFSSFGRETLTLLQDGEWGRAGAYVLASVLVGLFAVWAGAALATRIYGDGVS